MNINLPENVKYIIDRLEKEGYEAYIVGGCVRDSILNRIPNDWDITTNAKPEEVLKIFDKVIPTGIKHGTVAVVVNGEQYEVTTYRIDGKYSDSRRPDTVEFTDDIVKDLARRDFTINAMAYNQNRGLIDPFNGLRDIECKLIHTVGNAEDRFKEDPLRMLRAMRIGYQLGFILSISTLNAIDDNTYLLNKISKERIQSELNKMLLCNDEYVIRELSWSGLLEEINKDFKYLYDVGQNNPHHSYDVLFHTIKTVGNIENKLHLKLAALLHDIGKKEAKTTDENGVDHFYGHEEVSVKIAKNILTDLKYDNKTIDRVTTLIKYHDRNVEPTHKSVKKFINILGDTTLFEDWMSLRWADILAQNPKYVKYKARKLTMVELIYKDILEKQQPISLKDLEINGNDLIEIGYIGKEIGIMLNELLDMVIDNPNCNDKDYLLAVAKTEGKRIKLFNKDKKIK